VATGVGDLVATLRLDNSQFSAGLNQSAQIAGEKGEEIETHVGGASRAFRFLGKEAKEAGEAMGGSMGETVSGLGGVTSGLGEAVHGYHALHTAIEVATAAQASLNAISPMGWALMAGGAVAAAVAYMHFSDAAKEAEEAQQRLALAEKVAEVNAKMAHEAFEERKRSFLEGEHEIAAARDRAATSGMSEPQKFLYEFHEKHPDAGPAQEERAQQAAGALYAMQQKLEAQKAINEANKEEADFVKRVRDETEQLTAGPLDKQVKQINEIRKGVEMGIIGAGQGAAAEAKIQAELKEKMQAEQNQPVQQPQAMEKESDAAWKAILTAMQGGDKKDENAQKTADNTARIAALLQAIKDKPTGVIEFN